jgi:hypothetical protein
MKQVFRIDNNGFYIEPVIIGDNELVPFDCREDAPQEGFHKIKRNAADNGWEEGLSQEEIEAIKNAPQPLSDLEQLKKQQDLIQNALDDLILGGAL